MNNSGTAARNCQSNGSFARYSRREYAAIHLCVANSGDPEIDAMIRQARQDRGLDKSVPSEFDKASKSCVDAAIEVLREAGISVELDQHDTMREMQNKVLAMYGLRPVPPALPDEIGPDHPAVQAFSDGSLAEMLAERGCSFRSEEYVRCRIAAGLNAALKALREGGK